MKYNRIVLNIPHSQTGGLKDAEWSDYDSLCRHELRWVDWRTDMLFSDNCIAHVYPVVFPYSRFVCDAERLIDDPLESIGQGIIYTKFEEIQRTVTESERRFLMRQYYDHQLSVVKLLAPRCLLIDCHSFPSDLSEIDVCIGYNDDWSRPSDETVSLISESFKSKGLKVGINTPYQNSFSPDALFPYHSVMIELNKRLYLNENDTTLKYPGYNEIKTIIDSIYKKLLKFS